ncbi:hypothetical protein GHJ84_32190 [Sinorhizobium meliloti]|uniref:hypothetical protein n=1 Tax=Rhizobium meliloti TaxID=382 RepID=UPI0012964D5D|nr:hypothetical protein [Sinorhizobium meliloti]MQX25507.1 hypothetical protein [Sinorhizobium meliloti]
MYNLLTTIHSSTRSLLLGAASLAMIMTGCASTEALVPATSPSSEVQSPIATNRFLTETAAAAELGGTLKIGGNFKPGVDARLMHILDVAAQQTPEYRVEAFSGYRAGDPRFHGKGIACDVRLVNRITGRALPNYQDASSFREYEKFAQTVRRVQMKLYPDLNEELRWGGYFSGPKGKYGAVDLMHFDLGGNKTGMGGGSWEIGLTKGQRAIFPDAESVGMGSSARASNGAFTPVATDDAHVKSVEVDSKSKAALRDYIAESEGTAGQPGGGYSTSLDYGKWLSGGKEQDLTVLTLDQIDALQVEMLSHPENAARYPGGGSSAIGRYQIVRSTLKGLRAKLHLSGDQFFDAAMQDRLALTLACQRGATRDLGKEWASLRGEKLDKAIALARAAFVRGK